MNDEEPTPPSDVVTAALTAAAPPVEKAVEIFKCKKCGREFGKAQALATHEIRAHKKFWSTNVKRPGKQPAQSRYQHYRDKYRAQGLNSKGQPYKRKPRAGKQQKVQCPMCSRTFASSGNLGMHMSRAHGQSLREYRNGETSPARGGRGGRPRETGKRCPVCKKTFKKRPLMTHHLRFVHNRSITEFQGRGGAPLVPQEPTPTPEREPVAARKIYTAAKTEGRPVIYCPVCGTNIHNVQTAVNFGEK
jgi:uncharacterized C2H2 Zn-finger protein